MHAQAKGVRLGPLPCPPDASLSMIVRSFQNIVDVHWIGGNACAATTAPSWLFEVPHGATETADFNELAARLVSPLPDGLVDFFHVNTDVGAFELGLATAERLVAAAPDRCVIIIRSRIPRTFIDCNRRIDAPPEAFREGSVTPGLMPWITAAEDRALLLARYDQYLATVRSECGRAPDAAVLLLHSYAPRSVGVEVDGDIVASLRRAYAPEIEATWPLRPELDVIARDADGRSYAPPDAVEALRTGVSAFGWTVGDSLTYPLHPSTLAWDHVMARPGRTMCVEVRRDLLADPFDPFVRMHISAAKVDRLAQPLAAAVELLRA